MRTTEFGAFIRIADGIEGLLHISELGGKDLAHAKQVLKDGDEVHVVVERVDKANRKISLSKLSADDAEAIEKGEFDTSKAPTSLKQGAHVTVVIAESIMRGTAFRLKVCSVNAVADSCRIAISANATTT
ncbi:MAG: S1 RNA-binding domain-containing protein [Polyangiales bacterium]